MDLRHSPEDEDFRRELRSWLDTALPQEMRERAFWADKSEDEQFAVRRQWEADKARAGFAGILWPTEYGGRGGTPTMKADLRPGDGAGQRADDGQPARA